MKQYQLETIIKKNGQIFTGAQIDKMMKKLEYVKYHDEMLSANIIDDNPSEFASRLEEIADRIKEDFKNRKCPICGTSDARMISVFNCEHTTRQVNQQNEKWIFAYPEYAIPCPACSKTAGEEAVKRTFQKARFKGLAMHYIAYLDYNGILEPLIYILNYCMTKDEIQELITRSRDMLYKKPEENSEKPIDFSKTIHKLATDSTKKIDEQIKPSNYLIEKGIN